MKRSLALGTCDCDAAAGADTGGGPSRTGKDGNVGGVSGRGPDVLDAALTEATSIHMGSMVGGAGGGGGSRICSIRVSARSRRRMGSGIS